MRFTLYCALLVGDCVGIRFGFWCGDQLKGTYWMAPNGVELGWLVMPLYAFLGLRGGAFSLDVLWSRPESIRRSQGALLTAIGGIAMLMFFQHASTLVSRLAFGLAIVMSALALAICRFAFQLCFRTRDRSVLIDELVIIDGAHLVTKPQTRVFDAGRAGIRPDLRDPKALAQIAEIVARADRVIISCVQERRHDWALLLKGLNVTGEIVLSEGNELGAVGLDRFERSDTLIVARGSLSLSNRILKRTMDIIVSLTALVALAPLLLIVAVAIRIDSSGPILFRQPRVGRGNKIFQILKFRSMYAHKSDVDGARSTGLVDNRITRVGRFIRATSIDELPQLMNVLVGDMSIVGPRPHALGSLAGDKLFWEVTERYWLRHSLKPGITGLAQVRGLRGSTHHEEDLERRLQSDLEYVSGWRLWRDLTILLKTLRVVVHPNAY